MICRIGMSGLSATPHLHFQMQDSPSPTDANALPFVFATQLVEGRVPERSRVFDNLTPPDRGHRFVLPGVGALMLAPLRRGCIESMLTVLSGLFHQRVTADP